MKRGRVDGGVSKEQYEAAAMGFGSAGQDAFTGESSRASDLVLQTRKIYTKVTTRAQASQRQFAALNSGFVAAVQAQWRHNRQGDWTENMREYLAYARDAEATFGESEGQIMTFGSGDCGQLGHGVDDDDEMMVKYPRVVSLLAKTPIVRVACGGLHTAALTADGEVYTWGCNDDGALGRGGEENLPAKVGGFGPIAACAVQIVGGDCHTAVATLAGQVYSWGSYKDKEGKQWCDAASPKGSFKQKQVKPFLIKGLSNVVDLRCGSSFNLARTNDGLVFSWGLGEMGQLGRAVDAAMKDAKDEYRVDMVYREHLQPARMTLGRDVLPPVKAIGCGSYHSLIVLSVNGYLYTCGLNNYGQLGIGSTENCDELQLVEDLAAKNVVLAEGGTHHSAVLTIDGQVLTFGRADSGQLGTQDTCQTGDFKDRPQLVVFPKNSNVFVRSLACGSNHAVVLTESNDIYSWGYGDMLALGNGLEQDEPRPKQLNWAKTKFGAAEILQVEAGGQHSAVLARKRS